MIDPLGGDRTTSEGQSYALFFALVNNDRTRFDKVLTWTTANLGQGDLGQHLPAWSWGHGSDGVWGVMDANSASDSDLWIAYDLIEAGRLWKDPHYTALGRRLAGLVAHREIVNLPSFGPALLPGAVGFKFPKFWVVNPSYTPVFVLNRLAAVDPAGPWADVAAMFPTLIQRSRPSCTTTATSVEPESPAWAAISSTASLAACSACASDSAIASVVLRWL